MSKQRHSRKYLMRAIPEMRDEKSYVDRDTYDVMDGIQGNPEVQWEYRLHMLEQLRLRALKQFEHYVADGAGKHLRTHLEYTNSFGDNDWENADILYTIALQVADALGVAPKGYSYGDCNNSAEIPPQALLKRYRQLLANISAKLAPQHLPPPASPQSPQSPQGGEGDNEDESEDESEDGSEDDGDNDSEKGSPKGSSNETAQHSPSARPEGMGSPQAAQPRNEAQAEERPEESPEEEEVEEVPDEVPDDGDELGDELDVEKLPHPKYPKSAASGQSSSEDDDEESEEGEEEGENGNSSSSGQPAPVPHQQQGQQRMVGYGGGGPQVLRQTPEEQAFWAARQAILNLAVAPDVMNRPELGDDVIDARRLMKAKQNPAILTSLRKELGLTIDDVYLVLDTSGSVSAYADKIATVAAAAAGIVHLYSGSEARPQQKVERTAPLGSASEPFPEWRNTTTLTSKGDYGAFQAQFRREYLAGLASRFSYLPFEEEVAFWLEQERPPRGSHIIFWTDTRTCYIVRPTALRSLLANYHVTLMIPETRAHVVNLYSGEQSFQNFIKNGMVDMGEESLEHVEAHKFLAMDIPALYGVDDGQSFAEALRYVK